MLKKIASILGTFTLICFSFYYTDSAIDIIRKTDPIMKDIMEYSNEYGNTSIDAILVNNNIIPGTKGTVVDIDESYNKMKRLGRFDKGLIVFEEVLPAVSVSSNYDNYIISGNQNKKEVSLIFKANDGSFIEEIIRILSKKNVSATFFVSSSVFEESADILKLIIASGNGIELLDDTYSPNTVTKYNSVIKTLGESNFSFCYTNIKSNTILENCKKEKMHTIIPTIITENYPYNDIKNGLKDGSVISFNNNNNTVRELSSSINYILQKGKNIVPLKKILEE